MPNNFWNNLIKSSREGERDPTNLISREEGESISSSYAWREWIIKSSDYIKEKTKPLSLSKPIESGHIAEIILRACPKFKKVTGR